MTKDTVIKMHKLEHLLFPNGDKLLHFTCNEYKLNGSNPISTAKSGVRTFPLNKKELIDIIYFIYGKIETFKSTPYTKKDEKLDSISVAVFYGETALKVAATELKYFKAYPYDDKGEIYKLEHHKEVITNGLMNVPTFTQFVQANDSTASPTQIEEPLKTKNEKAWVEGYFQALLASGSATKDQLMLLKEKVDELISNKQITGYKLKDENNTNDVSPAQNNHSEVRQFLSETDYNELTF